MNRIYMNVFVKQVQNKVICFAESRKQLMKLKHAISAIVLLVAMISFFSCDDDEKEVNLTPPKVYIVDSDVNNAYIRNLSFDDVGEKYGSYKLALYRSGVEKKATYAKIVLLTQQELADYNVQYNEDFELLSADAYVIEDAEVSFSGEYNDINKLLNIDFDLSKLRSAHENAVLPIKISESSVDISEEKSMIIIKPRVVDIPISFKDNGSILRFSYPENESEDLIMDIQAIIDIEANNWDVEVELMVDADYVDQYNQQNGTFYRLLTTGEYELETTKIIKSGEKSTSFSLKINGEDLQSGQFMLPVRLKESSMFVVNREALFNVLIDIQPTEALDRTGWEVIDFNTEEAVGENNGNNGRVTHALDGDLNTFWHSKWKDGLAPLPHYLVIDMQRSYTLTQIGLIQRQSGTQDSWKGEFWISDDNDSWTQIGTFSLERIRDLQVYFVTPSVGRYLKVVLTESHHHDNVSSLAEIYPFGY